MTADLQTKVGYILVVIALPMAVGYVMRRWLTHFDRMSPQTCARQSRRLKLTCLSILVPPITVSAMIKHPLTGWDVVVMGGLGVACLSVGAMLGRLYVGWARPPAAQAGALLGCAAMSNLVSFGGLVTFAFWGNAGLQQLYLFKLLEHVLYFGVFYPWCSTYGPGVARQQNSLVASLRRQPLTLAPIGAVIVGLVFNYLLYRGPHPATAPPPWTQSFNHILVPFHVVLLTFAVGLTLRPSRIGAFARPCAVIASIVFIGRPAVAALLALMCMHMGWINDLAFRVVVVLSAMPVAFNALIPPALYDLDEDLANSCWMVTTGLLVVVVPMLGLILL